MEDGDDSAAAFEAALGLNPRLLVDDTLDMVDDIVGDAFEYARNKAAADGVLGADKEQQKAAELDRGFNAMHHLVLDVLDKRMISWEKYCFGKIFALPEGFVLPEDDNSCAKEPQRDGGSDPDLVELVLLRKKLESARKESENLRQEMSLLERQSMVNRELDSSIAEIQKCFEDTSRQQKLEELVKAMPLLQQQTILINEERIEGGSLVDLLRDNKRLSLNKDFTIRTEDMQEVLNILQNK